MVAGRGKIGTKLRVYGVGTTVQKNKKVQSTVPDKNYSVRRRFPQTPIRQRAKMPQNRFLGPENQYGFDNLKHFVLSLGTY
jgi:hypothetical protein